MKADSPEDRAEAVLRRALERANALERPVLAASSQRLGDAPSPLELLAAAEQRGEDRFLLCHPREAFSLLGLGCAWHVRATSDRPFSEVRHAGATCLADAVSDAPEPAIVGPLVLGGLAFEPRTRQTREPAWWAFGNAHFAVPEVLLTHRNGAVWLTRCHRVTPHVEPAALVAQATSRWAALLDKPAILSPPARARAGVRLCTSRRYRDAVSRVVEAIRRGEAEKVVLAESLVRSVPAEFRVAAALETLIASHPNSRSFVQGLGGSTFLGATPERLVRSIGGRVRADAVAGTIATAEASARRHELGTELQHSRKDQEEHAIVVRAIASVLEDSCFPLPIPTAPSVLGTGTVQHLQTTLRGTLREPTHIMHLAERLHPTPALGGTPRDAALAQIARIEGFDRGWYAGPIGWFDALGQGDFFVALRCGLVCGREARLFAGSGIVAESDPDLEAAETSLKFKTLWGALNA